MHGPGDVRFFDRFARLYDIVMPPARVAPIERGLTNARRPVERVLDVGGGSGRATVAIDAPERIVVDRSGGMLRRARSRGLDCVRGDATRLPVRDESVDAVTIVDALHHVGNQRAAVDEAYRALRPGGVLVVRDFNPATLLGRGLVAAERVVRFDSAFSTATELARFLERAGFEARLVEGGFAFTVTGLKAASDADPDRPA